ATRSAAMTRAPAAAARSTRTAICARQQCEGEARWGAKKEPHAKAPRRKGRQEERKEKSDKRTTRCFFLYSLSSSFAPLRLCVRIAFPGKGIPCVICSTRPICSAC